MGGVGPCPVIEDTSFGQNSAIELELRDREVGSGSAQQAMLSAGPDPVKPPIQAFGQNFFNKLFSSHKFVKVFNLCAVWR